MQHACTQPVSLNPSLQKWRWPWIGMRWCTAITVQPLRGGRFHPATTCTTTPMFASLILHAGDDGSGPGRRARLSGPRRADVLRREVVGAASSPNPGSSGTSLQLPVHGPRPAGLGWGDPSRRRILGQAAFTAFDGGELSPGPEVQSDDEILGWVAKDAETALHPSCTCRMGVDGDSVVDPATMRVHGLRDCASSTPRCSPTSRTATSTPVMMVAEKAADLILENTPLAPRQSSSIGRTRRRASASRATTTAIGATTRRISSQPP